MTSRERVLAALRGEEPDRVPIVECIDWAPLVRIAQLLGVDVSPADEAFAFERLAATLTEALEIDAVWVAMPLGETPVDKHHVRDRYGSVHVLSEHGEPVVGESPVGSLADPFKLSWKLRGGTGPLLMDFVRDPELAHRLARPTTDATVARVRVAADAGADVLLMEGDLAAAKAPFFSPAHFRAYVRPYYAETVAAAHERGLPIVKHSDGAMWPFMEDIVELGFDGCHPIQPQCMEIAEVKQRHGDSICLVGNIDCMKLLVFGREAEVAETVRATIDVAAPGGGYVLSSSNSIHSDVRPENYLAMVRAAREHREYGH